MNSTKTVMNNGQDLSNPLLQTKYAARLGGSCLAAKISLRQLQMISQQLVTHSEQRTVFAARTVVWTQRTLRRPSRSTRTPWPPSSTQTQAPPGVNSSRVNTRGRKEHYRKLPFPSSVVKTKTGALLKAAASAIRLFASFHLIRKPFGTIADTCSAGICACTHLREWRSLRRTGAEEISWRVFLSLSLPPSFTVMSWSNQRPDCRTTPPFSWSIWLVCRETSHDDTWLTSVYPIVHKDR